MHCTSPRALEEEAREVRIDGQRRGEERRGEERRGEKKTFERKQSNSRFFPATPLPLEKKRGVTASVAVNEIGAMDFAELLPPTESGRETTALCGRRIVSAEGTLRFLSLLDAAGAVILKGVPTSAEEMARVRVFKFPALFSCFRFFIFCFVFLFPLFLSLPLLTV